MIQGPLLPPPGVDADTVINALAPVVLGVVGLIASGAVLSAFFKSNLASAIAERIRHRIRGHAAAGEEGREHVAALEAQVASLRTEVSELAERVDFTERVLAERREPRLGAGQ